VIARLIKPVVVVRQDLPSVVETLSAEVVVDFDPVEGVREVVCDGKTSSWWSRSSIMAATISVMGIKQL